MSKNTLLIILVILIFVIGGSAVYYFTMNKSSIPSNSSQTANEVTIQGMAFTPTELKVTKGTTVTWTNKDIFVHSVKSDTNVFDSKDLTNGAHFSYTFNDLGEFPYHCSIHPQMRAKVIVE